MPHCVSVSHYSQKALSRIRQRKRIDFTVFAIGLLTILCFVCWNSGNLEDREWLIQHKAAVPKSTLQNVYTNQSKFLLSNDEACRDLPQNRTNFIIFLFTMFGNSEPRAIAREFWAGSRTEGSVHFTTMFIMGRPNVPPDGQASAWEQIHEEQRKFNDLIVLDMEEAYERLTEKTMALVSWAFRHCRDADYIMKSDDDVVIYLPRMAQLVPTWRRTRFYGGIARQTPKPDRETSSKWHLSASDFPDERFPSYCIGAGYLISSDLLPRVYWASLHIAPFAFEDVYFGYLVESCGEQVYIRHIRSFVNAPPKRCYMYNMDSKLALIHAMPVDAKRPYLERLLNDRAKQQLAN